MENPLVRILWGFAQAAFFGTPPMAAKPDFSDLKSRLKEHKTLKASTVALWPPTTQLALKELIAAWISFILAAELEEGPFIVPPDWLTSASSTRLSEPLVAEILHRFDALVSQSQYNRSKRSKH